MNTNFEIPIININNIQIINTILIYIYQAINTNDHINTKSKLIKQYLIDMYNKGLIDNMIFQGLMNCQPKIIKHIILSENNFSLISLDIIIRDITDAVFYSIFSGIDNKESIFAIKKILYIHIYYQILKNNQNSNIPIEYCSPSYFKELQKKLKQLIKSPELKNMPKLFFQIYSEFENNYLVNINNKKEEEKYSPEQFDNHIHLVQQSRTHISNNIITKEAEIPSTQKKSFWAGFVDFFNE